MSHLDHERKHASFDSSKLAKIFHTYDDVSHVEEFNAFQKTLAEDPIIKFDASELGLGRKELFALVAKKSARIHEIFGLANPSVFAHSHFFPNPVIASIHNCMFLPTIANLGTEKQVAKYYADACSLKILGCYAQTEMGHGSDVQSLETTATYDMATEEFVLHSPTISSTKWWPGDLGICATHAVTHAQLVVLGQNLGVQTFIVQLRDLETHLPLKGIIVGDIGSKMGYNSKDNGFLRFDNVRIPRENMLAKYVKLNKSGQLSKEGNDKIGYATMMFVRLMLVFGAPANLSMAATIAVRYSTFRKQFRDENGKERVILDYQLQLNKLIPVLAATYGMNAGSKKIVKLYSDLMSQIEKKQDFSIMPELHSLLSGTKSFYTSEALNGLEVCRQACGGHGYSEFSGISKIFSAYSPNVTLEGDNTIMALQTARYLIKSATKALKGEKLVGSAEYLMQIKDTKRIRTCKANSKNDFDSLDAVDQALQENSLTLVSKALQKFAKLMKEGLPRKEVWDRRIGLDLFAASRAHTNYFTFRSFSQVIQEEANDEKIAKVLKKLCLFYGIQKLLDYPLGVTSYFQSIHFDYLQEKKEDLLNELRTEAVALTDAFSFMDETLHSALAVSDGRVYETMYEWAQKNQLNKEVPNEAFMKYIKPVMGKFTHLDPKPKL